MSYLKLVLKAPMMSFGGVNYWLERKETSLIPQKSALIGMIGAAFGLPRNHELLNNLNQKLTFYLDYDNSNKNFSVMEDYQTANPEKNISYKEWAQNSFIFPNINKRFITAAGGKEENMTTTTKEFIQNGCFIVYIKGEKELLQKISHALNFPFYPLYIGRKCCIPSCPVNQGIYENIDSNYLSVLS